MNILRKQFNLLKKKYDMSVNVGQKGFTLVELMVSLMLFTIVVLAAVGSLYSVNNASRKTQAMRSVIDNLNFAMESMSRTIRTANSVVCGGYSLSGSVDANCPFENQNPNSKLLVDSTLGADQLVEYQLGTNADGTGAIQKRVQEGGIWSNWISVTAPEINVKELDFYVSGADVADNAQPSVMMFVRGSAVTSEETQPFVIQTYLSQRAIE